MIRTLNVRNFKILREVELELQPLTVIVGPNSSGKSSILQALRSVMELLLQGPQDIFNQTSLLESIRTRHQSEPLLLSGTGRFHNYLEFEFKDKGPSRIQWQGNVYGFPSPPPITQDLRAKIKPADILNLDVRKMAEPSYPKTTDLRLARDGEDLSALLASLALEERERFDRLMEQLRSVVPSVRRIRVQRAKAPEGRIGYETLFDMAAGESIPAEHVSDGTLLTLGILTALAVPESPQLLLIDDLERGLHPRAIGDLIQQLRKIQELDPELQIVATSHSPYLLDYLKAEEVLLTTLDEDGYAAVARLTDHPEYERWKDVMAPGELWSTVGESWIVEQQKKTAKPAS